MNLKISFASARTVPNNLFIWYVTNTWFVLMVNVASAGLGFLHYCNLNSFRTKLILGFSLFMGLSLPQYFREYQLSHKAGPVHTHSRWVCLCIHTYIHTCQKSLHLITIYEFIYNSKVSISPICFVLLQFNDTIYIIFMSHTTVAALVALILDRSLPHLNDQSRKDNGSELWDKFVSYSKDCRSNEFYKLPFGLNNYFPPL